MRIGELSSAHINAREFLAVIVEPEAISSSVSCRKFGLALPAAFALRFAVIKSAE
jgi:hypothetical protein